MGTYSSLSISDRAAPARQAAPESSLQQDAVPALEASPSRAPPPPARRGAALSVTLVWHLRHPWFQHDFVVYLLKVEGRIFCAMLSFKNGEITTLPCLGEIFLHHTYKGAFHRLHEIGASRLLLGQPGLRQGGHTSPSRSSERGRRASLLTSGCLSAQ